MPPKSVPKDVRAVSIPKTGADAPFAVLPIVSSIDISTRPTTPASVDNDDDDDSDLPELVAGQEDEYSEEENGTKKPAVPKKRGGGIGATEKSISDETKGRTCARLGCGAKINDYSSDRCMRHTQKDRAAIPVYPHKNMLPSASDTGKKSKPTTAVTPTQSPVVAKSSLRMQTSSRVVLASTVVLPESIVGALPAAAEKLKEEGKMQQLAPHRNYKRAIELYTQSLKLAPRHIERAKILGNRSACYVELGDWEAAIADAKLAIQIDKTYVRGYTRLEDAVAGLALQNPVGAVGGELPRTSPKSQRQHSVDDQLPRLVSGGDDDDDDDDDEYLNFDGEGDDVEVDGQGEGEWKGDAQNEQGDADDDDDDEKEDDEETKEWKPDDLVYRNSAASDRKGSSESKRSASLEPAAIVKVLDGPDFSECIKSQRTDYAAHKYSAVERNINTILKPYGIQLPRSAFELALIRAQIRCATRKYEIAAKDGELITTIWPDRSESWAIRGRATFALGTHHLQKALECYRKADDIADKTRESKRYDGYIRACEQTIVAVENGLGGCQDIEEAVLPSKYTFSASTSLSSSTLSEDRKRDTCNVGDALNRHAAIVRSLRETIPPTSNRDVKTYHPFTISKTTETKRPLRSERRATNPKLTISPQDMNITAESKADVINAIAERTFSSENVILESKKDGNPPHDRNDVHAELQPASKDDTKSATTSAAMVDSKDNDEDNDNSSGRDVLNTKNENKKRAEAARRYCMSQAQARRVDAEAARRYRVAQAQARRVEEAEADVVDPVLLRMARDRGLEMEATLRRHEEKVGAKWIGQCGRSKCHRISKRVSDHEMYYQIECSAGCKVVYHKSCWGPVTKEYRKDDLEGGAACLTPDCDGAISSLEHFDKDDMKNKHRVYVQRPEKRRSAPVAVASDVKVPYLWVPDPKAPEDMSATDATDATVDIAIVDEDVGKRETKTSVSTRPLVAREWRALDLAAERKTKPRLREEEARTRRAKEKEERAKKRRADARVRRQHALMEGVDVSDVDDDLTGFVGDDESKEAERKQRQTQRRLERHDARERERLEKETSEQRRLDELQKRALGDKVVPLQKSAKALVDELTVFERREAKRRRKRESRQRRRVAAAAIAVASDVASDVIVVSHEREEKNERKGSRMKKKGISLTLSEFHQREAARARAEAKAERKATAEAEALVARKIALEATEDYDNHTFALLPSRLHSNVSPALSFSGESKRTNIQSSRAAVLTQHQGFRSKLSAMAPSFQRSSSSSSSSSGSAIAHESPASSSSSLSKIAAPVSSIFNSSARPVYAKSTPGIWVRLSRTPTRSLCISPCSMNVTAATLGEYFKQFGNVRVFDPLMGADGFPIAIVQYTSPDVAEVVRRLSENKKIPGITFDTFSITFDTSDTFSMTGSRLEYAADPPEIRSVPPPPDAFVLPRLTNTTTKSANAPVTSLSNVSAPPLQSSQTSTFPVCPSRLGPPGHFTSTSSSSSSSPFPSAVSSSPSSLLCASESSVLLSHGLSISAFTSSSPSFSLTSPLSSSVNTLSFPSLSDSSHNVYTRSIPTTNVPSRSDSSVHPSSAPFSGSILANRPEGVPPTADEMRLLECSDNDVEGVFRQIEGQVSALVATVDDDDDDRDSDEDDEDDE